MGINEDNRLSRRMSLKRLSHRMDGLMQKLQPKKRASAKRIPSDVSDINSTRGAALNESNALNEDGLHIIDNIAQNLEQRLAAEDRLNVDDHFSTGKVPAVSVYDYVARLARYVNVWRGHAGGRESAGVRAAVMTIYYLEKLERSRPDYAINQLNVHRLLCAGFLVSVKFTEDTPISNSFWSKVGGVQMNEVNALESEFCKLFDFQLYVDDNEYARYLDQFDLPEF